MRSTQTIRLLLILALLALGPAARGQQEGGGTQPPAGSGGPPGRTQPRVGIKPYAEVVTKDARTSEGLFKVHRIDEKVLFEIPASAMGKEILWVITMAKAQTGYGFNGVEVLDRVVRWTRRGDRVLLRGVDFQLRSESGGTVKRSVEDSTVEPILQAFDIRALGPGESPVIDVTSLFTSEVAELSARRQLGASRLDSTRTFIEKIKAFPRNVEAAVLATYSAGAPTPGAGFPTRQNGPRRDGSVESVTVMLHHSIVALPDQPMKPRLYDTRVGFFNGMFTDVGRDEHKAVERRYIRRWRLEKRDPNAAVSEPVKPIVYYVGREVPEKWRPWIKKGIEDWQSAFEAAGFKNAIVARDAPSETEDPDWDAEDVRHSSIRWLPSTTENAYGPHIADPRTGEILDADVKVYHNVLKLIEGWYFVQASPNDPRAQKLPLPDELIGECLRYVIAHEVGHTLGLMHNMKASSAFSVDQLRSAEFTKKWGTEASIMDYGRMNYVAQPGDGARLIPKLGPYDYFAIEWGYKPLPDCPTCDAERTALDQIAARQMEEASLRFGDAEASEDPSRQSEDLGSDPVEATRLGLCNLKRVLGYLVTATCKPGEDYSDLKEMFGEVVSQRSRELGHVVAVVGGVVETDTHYGRGAAVYTPVPASQQRAAVSFLLQNCFATPRELTAPDILDRIEASGAAGRVLGMQTSVLNSLLNEGRITRMIDQEVVHQESGYTPLMLMDDIRKGIWTELGARTVVVDPYRRNLQRAYLQTLAGKIGSGSGTGSQSEMRGLARGALKQVQAGIQSALPRTTDARTRLHLEDCLAQIQRALSTQPVPAAAPAVETPPPPPRRRG